MFLVIWNHYPLKYMPQHTQSDHYATFETLEEATKRYDELIEEGVSVCSIAPVLRSTDYTPQFLMPLAKQQLADQRERLWAAETREEHEAIRQELQA